ncbi:MAG: hypothetical protein IJ685_10405 [Selenomonadaceae bacterium]|nr:hypothetical protein [Selenomonadaceae bacterium]
MANEILKAEILDDEQLEQVAGGNRSELCRDSEFLNRMGYKNELFDDDGIVKAWAAAGITIEPYWRHSIDNRYYLGGNRISRKDAFIHALQSRGFNEIAIQEFNFDKYGVFDD